MSTNIFNNWNKNKVIAGHTTDFGGQFHYNKLEDLTNYESVGKIVGIKADHMIRVNQNHTDQILSVNENNGGEGIMRDGTTEDLDAMVTDTTGLMLCVITADCTPIFLYDEEKGAIGLVHSGRDGTVKEIALLTVQKMQQLYGSDPHNMKCILGPYICREHYEVSKEDLIAFSERFSDREIDSFSTVSGGHAHVDIGAAAEISLIRAGLRKENIFNCGICTYEHPELYSWRRDGDPEAHILSFIAKLS